MLRRKSRIVDRQYMQVRGSGWGVLVGERVGWGLAEQVRQEPRPEGDQAEGGTRALGRGKSKRNM